MNILREKKRAAERGGGSMISKYVDEDVCGHGQFCDHGSSVESDSTSRNKNGVDTTRTASPKYTSLSLRTAWICLELTDDAGS